MHTTTVASKILREFSKKKANYCIIRNYDCFINRKVHIGKDIDIVIDKKSVKIVSKILEKNGFQKEAICPFSKHIGYAKYIDKDMKLLKFHLHVEGITGNHVTYLSAADVLKRKRKLKHFYILSKEDEYLSLLLHSLGGERYRKQLSSLRPLDKEYLIKKIRL